MDVGFVFEGFHVEPGGRQRPDGSWQPVATVRSTATHEPLAWAFDGNFGAESEALEEAAKLAERRLKESSAGAERAK